MRTAALIFSTLLLLATAGLGFLAANRGIKDAKAIDEIYGSAKDAIGTAAASGDESASELKSLGEATGRLRAGAVFLGVTGALALALLVLAFMGKQPATRFGAIATVVAAALGVVLSPQYDLGPLAPASARSLAYVVAVIAVLGAASAYGAAQAKMRRGRVGAPLPA